MTTPLIKTQNLSKYYDSGKHKTHALRGVSLEIPAGAFACVTGPSGHGKSTLLHLLGGLDRPTGGSVYVDGEDISRLGESRLAALRTEKIGFVFQFYNLLKNLTALENIETAMMFAGVPARKQKTRAAELLELVGLREKAAAKPSELSGGQQQRVSIARALANDPEILMMDEPTGNLDTAAEEEVLRHIFDIHKRGKTIIMVTHNEEIAKMADLRFVIRDGLLDGQ